MDDRAAVNVDPPEWEFGFVLPNLVLPSDPNDTGPGSWSHGLSVAPDLIAIAPNTDPRMAALRRANPAVDQILSAFRDQHGKRYEPAVLIISTRAPESVRLSLEAIVAFRNIVAMSIILRGRAALARGHEASTVTWSDSFDFHPAQVGRSGHVVIQSPALMRIVSRNARITLTHSPSISLEGRRLWADRYLLWAGGKAWRRRFSRPILREAFGDRLFRSLDVAYQACGIGSKNEASLNEYGTQLALWVSACEILAWPTDRHAHLDSVLAMLARYPAREATHKLRFRAKVRGKPMRLSAVQRAYTYLYKARNHFLHGNPVSSNMMFTLNRRERIALPRIAAIVYRAALVTYLDTRYKKELISLRDLKKRPMEIFDDHNYEEAFANIFGYSLRQRSKRSTISRAI